MLDLKTIPVLPEMSDILWSCRQCSRSLASCWHHGTPITGDWYGISTVDLVIAVDLEPFPSIDLLVRYCEEFEGTMLREPHSLKQHRWFVHNQKGWPEWVL